MSLPGEAQGSEAHHCHPDVALLRRGERALQAQAGLALVASIRVTQAAKDFREAGAPRPFERRSGHGARGPGGDGRLPLPFVAGDDVIANLCDLPLTCGSFISVERRIGRFHTQTAPASTNDVAMVN